MEFASIIPNFFNILAGAWYNTVFDGLFLFLDGVIFSLVSLAFDVFIMTCQINFDALYAVIAPLLDRIEAVIMVLVVFKLGISFIGYMIEPEKAPAEGKKLIINIFITAALLLSYNFIFSVFNDISMLLLGAPENYPYTTLSNIADIQPGEKDEGLIMRFIFGKNDAIKNSNIGDFMAYQTLNIFLRETTSNKSLVDELDPGGDGNYEFRNISNLSDEVGKTFDYMPLIGTVIGLFLIYSIVKVSIEIGIRMFKMLILQILAPVAIITCIDGGVKSKTFSTYYKTFLGVFVQVFVRVFVMYVITVFACKFFLSIGDFVNDLPNAGIKKYLVAIVIIVAGFKMVNDIPKFIDEALGTKIAGTDNKGGFGKFVGGLIGGGIGLATGLGAGMAAGSGLFGSLGNAVAGGVTGFTNGSKGAKASEMIKNIGESNKANRERATKIARQGGGLRYAGAGIENFLGIPQKQAMHSQRLKDDNTLIQKLLDAQANAIANETDRFGIKYGSDKSSYAGRYAERALAGNSAYQQLLKEYEDAKKGIVNGQNVSDTVAANHAAAVSNLMATMRSNAEKDGETVWETAAGNATGNAVSAAKKELGTRGVRYKGQDREQLKKSKENNEKQLEKGGLHRGGTNRGASRRANRQGGFGGN